MLPARQRGDLQLSYTIEYACVSDRGLVRAVNQDNYFCGNTFAPRACEKTKGVLTGWAKASEGALFGVFDGMGGEQAGEDASYLAASAAKALAVECRPASLRQICEEANSRIVDFTIAHDLDVCGSTAAMICFYDKQASVCNLGDSRVYQMQKGKLAQMSRDQVVPMPGRKKPALAQFLGMTEMQPEPCMTTAPLKAGDCFLICSDGLTDMVAEQDASEIIAGHDALKDAGQALLDAALAAGGRDNVTIILLRVTMEKRTWKDFFPFSLLMRHRDASGSS